MSAPRRFWLYIYGLPNILGSALALAGLALFFIGIIKSYWLFIVAGLYGIGYLAAPRPVELSLKLEQAWNEAELRGKIADLARLARRILPDSDAKRVERIQQAILDILSHAKVMEGEPFQLQIVRQTVNDYLPTVLQTYARLPGAFARIHPVRNGKTAQQLVEEQLGLIETELNSILVGISQNDAQALIVHGEFLKKKLDSGANDF
ncbi:MAG: hypothetical protein HC850_09530 [Rhodomicrobium sp.]|nr:hypothetical protein [Rhodomicrobium sp.]